MSDADAKRLDASGDAVTRVGNAARIVAAGPLSDFMSQVERLFDLTESGRIRHSMVAIADEIEQIEPCGNGERPRAKKAWAFYRPEADDQKQLDGLKQLKERLADAGAELFKLRGAGAKPATPFIPPTPIATGDAA